ncbi:MAG: acyl-CoA-binding protein [Deltaproteobacteria bacterium]|nr:acyl-CoA-binding protein [Deltaproteobacteria bacterium]
MDLDARFEDAAVRVKGLPSASPDQLLKLYSLYKQGTLGDVAGKRPGMLDIRGRAKYDAWAARKGMGQDEAKQAYIDYVDELLGA